MKKFKTKNNNKIKFIVLVIFIIILFTILSFYKLNKSFTNIINYSLKGFSPKSKRNIILTSNLDFLINDYYFINILETYKTNISEVYIYNTNKDEIYHDNSTVIDTSRLLQNKLTKLGIKTIIDNNNSNYLEKFNLNNNYLIDIHRDNIKDTSIIINDKKYAKIQFILYKNDTNYLKNKELSEKMDNYLNNNYPGISRGIYEKETKDDEINENLLIINIGGIENNIEEVDNSTEILSLMIYYIIGDGNEKNT